VDPIINVKDLTKKFKDFTAVDGISFSVEKGEFFGLLGPNGAGKTTDASDLNNTIIDRFCVDKCTYRNSTLEDVFLRLTGRELRE
jgi:ABC-type branched-subunit amino acid transport system ATPase component